MLQLSAPVTTPLSTKGGAGFPAPSGEPWGALLPFPILLTQAGANSELGLLGCFPVTLDKTNKQKTRFLLKLV